jgi:hypothetical protein
MAKAAVVVLADIDTHADLGRVVNGLMVAKECKETGDDVRTTAARWSTPVVAHANWRTANTHRATGRQRRPAD